MSLSSVVSDFLSKGREPVEPSDRIFPPIDLDGIRRDCKPEQRGAEDGAANLPSPEAKTLSAAENAILAELERTQQIYVNTHDRMQAAYLTRVSALAHEWKLDAIENEEEERVNKVLARAKEQANEILRPLESLRASGRELLKYRQEHELTSRLPVEVSGSRVITVLIAVMAVELIVSFFLIRESGDPQQQVVLALIFATLNSFLPAGLGKASITLNYRWGLSRLFDLKKIFGWVLLCGSAFAGVVINLMMAHYRALSMELAQESVTAFGDREAQWEVFERTMSLSADSLARLQHSGFDLGDTWSYLLFFIGAICFLVAFVEGFRSADTYPQYTRLSKRFEHHFDTYEEAVSDIIEQLTSDQAAAVKDIERFKHDIAQSYAKVPEIVSRSITLTNNCEAAVAGLDTRLMQLVQEYRTANQKERTQEAPTYFHEKLDVPALTMSHPQFPDLDEGVKKELEETLAKFVEKLHAKFKIMVRDIVPAEQVLDAYPLSVEQ